MTIPEQLVEPLEQPGLHQVELRGPGRRAAGDRDHAVALGDRARPRPRPPRRMQRGHAACASASRVRGAASPRTSRRAAARAAGRPPRGSRGASRRADRKRHAAVVISISARSPPSGRCAASVAVITAWPLSAQQLDQQPAPLGVELAHHVVEQHQRRGARRLEQRLALGEQQRQQRRALLALGAVAPQRRGRRARPRARRGAVRGSSARAPDRSRGAREARRRSRPDRSASTRGR